MKIIVFLLVIVFSTLGCSHGNKKPKIKRLIDLEILEGSKESQAIQNKLADSEGLSRIKNDNQLRKMKANGYLVSISKYVDVDIQLKEKFRFVRPWTNKFLDDMGKSFTKEFSKKLQVNSAVRTAEYQEVLKKSNVNASNKSSHLTGATVDLAKKDLTPEELNWCREYLISFEKKGLIEATEEQKQLCFHIMVFRKYSHRSIQ